MFERPQSGERTLLVHLNLGRDDEDLSELQALAVSAGAELVGVLQGSRSRPDPGYFIGVGKRQELREQVLAEQAELVIFNHALTPGQERNLERELQVRVLDRTGLILDIFAQRAQSFEGKLQVELAQLRHLSTRLVRGWTHLERQKGGIGLRGPGETQLETDRRLLHDRIRQIRARLGKVERQRHQGRQARQKADIPTIALVGYTNAGKSTLFNRLTDSAVLAADQLFATLDPTLRRCELTDGSALVLADTVGFIRHLPHELVAAFRSTLQEVCKADLLLHVIDAGSEDKDDIVAEVRRVLNEIGADHVPQIEVYNKTDALEESRIGLERDVARRIKRVRLSARTGEGVASLDQALSEFIHRGKVRRRVHLLPSQGDIRAGLYRLGRILSDEVDGTGGWYMDVELHEKDLGLLSAVKASPVTPEYY